MKSAPLFIFEMANNHQGDVNHGLEIINQMAAIAKRHGIKAAIKLQYRDLDTFIHPDADPDAKHVGRFLGTRLNNKELQMLVQATKDNGLISIVTPFDEPSVDLCCDHNVDILKIASCSSNDWSLLEAAAKTGKWMIISTGGCQFLQIDKLVNFLEHRDVNFALMHCVALYPTPPRKAGLDFMQALQNRYTQEIGYSGHESPDELGIARAVTTMGSMLFERHVGVETNEYKLNAYSMNPGQTDTWIQEIVKTREMFTGMEQGDRKLDPLETQSLRELQRGVFARLPIEQHGTISNRVYFAFPPEPDQTLVSEFNPASLASRSYKVNDPIFDKRPNRIFKMRSVVHEAKRLLREARISIGNDYNKIELSHHYGMEKFREYGTILIDVINREYCKKIVICLKGQTHPYHYHQKKEETFQVLYGTITLMLKGENQESVELNSGDQFLIKRGMIHGWYSSTGCVFEEISTTSYADDSFYLDEAIAAMDPTTRKTIIEQW